MKCVIFFIRSSQQPFILVNRSVAVSVNRSSYLYINWRTQVYESEEGVILRVEAKRVVVVINNLLRWNDLSWGFGNAGPGIENTTL